MSADAEAPPTIEGIAADNAALVHQLVAVGTEQRDELRVANHRRNVEIGIVVTAIVLFAILLGVALVMLGKVRSTQLEGGRRGEKILAIAEETKRIAKDTNQVAVQFNCAIELQRTHPEWAAPGLQSGEIEAFDSCVAAHRNP